MSVRSNWCEFDKETRKYIKKRDGDKCVICGNKGALQIMHIFLNRSHGGKGCKENGCLGCIKCHRIIDNFIGEKEKKLSEQYLQRCKNYLIEKEYIIYNKEFIESLKFNKQKYLEQTEIKAEQVQVKKYNRCKDCIYLKKKPTYNSTLPSYYCRYKQTRLNKSTKACNKFERKLGNT